MARLLRFTARFEKGASRASSSREVSTSTSYRHELEMQVYLHDGSDEDDAFAYADGNTSVDQSMDRSKTDVTGVLHR